MRYYIADASFPLEYISSGNLLSKQDFLHPKRILDTCVLILVKEGILFITQAGVNYEVHPNQYIFLYANEEHYGFSQSPGKLSYLWAHFALPEKAMMLQKEQLLFKDIGSGELMEGIPKDIYIMPEHGDISLVRKVPLLFNQLLDLAKHDQIYSKYITNYAVSLLVMEISQEFYDKYNKDNQNLPTGVSKIMEWIRSNYFLPLTVASIANEFGYNPDYLSTLFKKSTNNTLINYINKTRVDTAKSLIVTYDISVKEAAYSCGFTDEKYFMKTFKKFENMTPSQYKKAFIHKTINN
ncbi:MAG: transcriptional regulator, AraC family [Herbinix sp.]|jgi:AraC-like DNA-binding protein|nr:transcriptional regulator, AraC family [Herbinix sp.]